MKTLARVLGLLCSMVWTGIRTWWASRGDKGVEADDPDKESEPQ